MAFLLSSERPPVAAATPNPVRAFVAWLAQAGQRRNQRIALATLLDYDAAALDDLGINRADLFDALEHPSQRPGLTLARRRALSSSNWLNP